MSNAVTVTNTASVPWYQVLVTRCCCIGCPYIEDLLYIHYQVSVLEGGQSPNSVADVLWGEAGQLLQSMPAERIQEGGRRVVSQCCICPDHVGHALGLEAANEDVAVPGCCIHELWL